MLNGTVNYKASELFRNIENEKFKGFTNKREISCLED